jgi:hypothetical protein
LEAGWLEEGESYLFFLFLTILTVAAGVNSGHASEERKGKKKRRDSLKCAFGERMRDDHCSPLFETVGGL